MITEIKVKTVRPVDKKVRRKTETYIKENCEVFAEAEAALMEQLSAEQSSKLLESYETQSLRISPIKEVCKQYRGNESYVITMRDIFIDDNGNEKPLKYKVLLWADSLSDANTRAQELASQGYDMRIESIRETEVFLL